MMASSPDSWHLSRPHTLAPLSAAQQASRLGTQVALRWFFARSLVRQQGLTREHIDRIPGKQTDRKTPLGELNWIFTAVTDTIAWNLLPRALFQRLFRQVQILHLNSGACVARVACLGWQLDMPKTLPVRAPPHTDLLIDELSATCMHLAWQKGQGPLWLSCKRLAGVIRGPVLCPVVACQ